jgi:hypothetical protein
VINRSYQKIELPIPQRSTSCQKNYLSVGSISVKPFPYHIVTSFGCLEFDFIVHMKLIISCLYVGLSMEGIHSTIVMGLFIAYFNWLEINLGLNTRKKMHFMSVAALCGLF